MLKIRKKIVLFSLLLVFFLGASFVLAQKPLEITYPEIQGFAPTTTKTILPDYILYIFQFSLYVAALIAFGSFIYGGFRYLTSGTSSSIKKDARSQISAGMLGLIILLSSYIILNTIDPQLKVLKSPFLKPGPSAGSITDFPEPQPATYLGISAGAVITNLWGEKHSPAYKSAKCYKFNSSGDATVFLPDNDRLDCIQKLSQAIKIKAENLKNLIEDLHKFYDCKFCCANCCESVCDWNEEEEYWENCGEFDCCKEQGLVEHYHSSYNDRCSECGFSNCCKFFENCSCTECKECICVKPNGECCNPDDPDKHYEDPDIKNLIAKIKQAKAELNLKLGPFSLIEELSKSENLDALLVDEETKDLIKKILIGNPIDKEKLKRILKIKEVMEYLIKEGDYWNLLLADENLAEIISSFGDPPNKEKLTWVLRYNENLKKILESKDYLGNVLVGEDARLKKLLNKKEIIQILLEDKNNLNQLCGHSNVKEVFKKILRIEQESEWLDFIAVIPETAVNLKLVNEFQRDLLWVSEVADLMRTCETDPVSVDQLRVPEEFLPYMEKVIMPEWEDFEIEILGGPDPATFYCPKPLW